MHATGFAKQKHRLVVDQIVRAEVWSCPAQVCCWQPFLQDSADGSEESGPDKWGCKALAGCPSPLCLGLSRRLCPAQFTNHVPGSRCVRRANHRDWLGKPPLVQHIRHQGEGVSVWRERGLHHHRGGGRRGAGHWRHHCHPDLHHYFAK